MYIRAGIAPITTTTVATQPKLRLSLAAPAVNALGAVEFAAAEALTWLVLAGLTRKLDISVVMSIEELEYGIAEVYADLVEDDEGAGVVSGGQVTYVVIGDFVMVVVIVLPRSTY